MNQNIFPDNCITFSFSEMESVTKLQEIQHLVLTVQEIQCKYDKIIEYLNNFIVWKPIEDTSQETLDSMKQIQSDIYDIVEELKAQCEMFHPRVVSIESATRCLESALMSDYEFSKLYSLQDKIVKGH